MTGVTTPNVDPRPLVDELIGNRDGTTVRIAVQSLAMQLLAQPAFGGAAFASINLFRPSLSNILRGALELFPDPVNDRVITGINTAAAAGGSQLSSAPVEFSVAGVAILLPSCDTIEFSWSGGNFAASGAASPETDCIIIYQRG